MREELADRVTLRLGAATPERRKVARALLAEAAQAAGGRIEEAAEALLLVGAEPGRARRLRDLFDRILGEAAIVSGRREPPPSPAAPALPALDEWLRDLDPLLVARRRRGWRLAGEGARPAFLRLEVARDDLARLLGPLGADADLLDHAQSRMASRLLAALAEAPSRRALLGEGPVGRLHLRFPEDPNAATPQGLVVSVPLAAAADPQALATRRAALAACGGALEIEGLDAAALALLDAAALPADLLRLAWSPSLAAVPLEGVDPARLVLAGADPPEAREWARRRGITLVEAEAV